MPAPGLALVADLLAEVEARLAGDGGRGVAPIPAVSAHVMRAGGKRIRPLVLLLSARAHGIAPERAVPLAVAAELLHTASLLHDDVVDEATLRRGKDAARLRWGNAATVLVGDFYLAQGLAAISSFGDPRPVATLSEVVADLAQGELIQLAHRGQITLDSAPYFEVARRKTASLLAWCARVGGSLEGAADHAMSAYGLALGTAFQLTDDLLDLVGDPDATGKDLGADLREGKLTLPLLEACRLRPELVANLRSIATSDEDTTALQAQTLRAVIRSGALHRVSRKAQELAHQARAALSALAPSPARTALEELALFCVQRVT